MNILLVENDDTCIKVVSYFLKDSYNLDAAQDGITALQMIQGKNYNAILMDIDLGTGMNGLEVANKIKEFHEYENIPIIAVTAYALENDRKKFLAEGCSSYLSKPFSKNDLLTLLKSIL